jgi:hypothetical protein
VYGIGRKNSRGPLGPFYQTNRPTVEQLFYAGLAGLGLAAYTVEIGMIDRIAIG